MYTQYFVINLTKIYIVISDGVMVFRSCLLRADFKRFSTEQSFSSVSVIILSFRNV